MRNLFLKIITVLYLEVVRLNAANSHVFSNREKPRDHTFEQQTINGPPKNRRAEGVYIPQEYRDAAAISDEIGGYSDGRMWDKLRSHLLSNYDKNSYPWEFAWSAASSPDGNRPGLTVELGVNFHRVYDVDVSNSVIDLVVWVRQRWIDPRLTWDPNDYNNITKSWFWIGDGSGPGGETSEIWTPDLQLWNMESPLSQTLTDTQAHVTHDGTVWWSRPGHLKPICKFKGLEEFPFDKLNCTIEIGSWDYSANYIHPRFMGEKGFTLGGSDTSGESFSEFTIQSVDSEEHIYPPFVELSEVEEWPVIFYHVSFKRAWQPYARGYIMLQIALNLVGFCCFWIPPHLGERMGLAITAMLSAVASELVVSSSLPNAAEITWFSTFSLISMFFAILVLFQSTIVIYLFHLTEKDLVPMWYKSLVRLYKGHIPSRRNRKSLGSIIQMDSLFNNEGQQTNANFDDDKEDIHIQLRRDTHLSGFGDANDFQNIDEVENNLKWRKIAISLDDISRFIFPSMFAIVMAIIF